MKTPFPLPLLLLLPALTLAALVGAVGPAPAASLRPSVVVEADVVRLGDIFEDAGPHAERAVLHAPAPGRRVTLDVQWLAEVARLFRVAWRPLSRFDRVVVERAGKTITTAEIVHSLRAELEAEGMPKHSQIELLNRSFQISVPLDLPSALDVRNVSYDAATGRFDALVLAGGDHPGAQRVMVAGRTYRASPVPVLRRPVAAGEIIRKDDIEIVFRRDDQIVGDMVVDAARLVGTTPRSRLRAGEPVRESDTRPPIVVARNSQVIIKLVHGPMTLTAQGRALEDGARGDVIRVTNMQSKKTIEATIESADVVSVSLGPRLALN